MGRAQREDRAIASTAGNMADKGPEDAEHGKDTTAVDAENAWSDELSDVSDNSDLEHTAVDEQKTWTTE